MPHRRAAYQKGSVGPERLSESFREARYGFEPFAGEPFSWSTVDGFGDPVGTTGRVNGVFTGHNTLLWHVLGTQDIVVPAVTTDGFYNFGLDQTLADGFELGLRSNTATTGGNHPADYTMGTDECFFRLLWSAEDVSGADMYVGFRKVEAFQAAIATYTDLAAIRTLGDSSSAAGANTIVTNLNNATDVTASTLSNTLADATAVEHMVQVKGRTAHFFINGAEVERSDGPFTFDSTDVITPFVFFLNTTDVVGELKLRRMEWGLLEDYSGETLDVP